MMFPLILENVLFRVFYENNLLNHVTYNNFFSLVITKIGIFYRANGI